MTGTPGVWMAALALAAAGAAQAGYVPNPSDFATEVVAYAAGTGGFTLDPLTSDYYTDPFKALGRPTVDTTGDGGFFNPAEPAPVVPVYGPFRSTELVQIGHEGSLVVRFERPVEDHPANPYGIDFTIFGNAQQTIDGITPWLNRDPDGTVCVPPGYGTFEPGTVSVSQDGVTWHRFTDEGDPNAPDPFTPPYGAYDGFDPAKRYADHFAPTLGRVLAPDAPHRPDAAWDWNQWWGEPTDPTRPLDPAKGYTTYGGMTVGEIAADYGASAGGTGFDLAALDVPGGLDWILYVRIDNFRDGVGATPEIDAVADVAPPGWGPGDLDKNLVVDARDIDLMSRHLDDPAYGPGYDLDGDRDADTADRAVLLGDILGVHPGDADLSGRVDTADYFALASHWFGAGGWADGDATGDGLVNTADYFALADHWYLPPVASAAPGPATLGLAAAGLAALVGRRAHF